MNNHCHYPRGISKFNKIERHLIASTTTSKGLHAVCEVDRAGYERGNKVSDAEMDSLDFVCHDFHGEWSHLVRVRPTLDLASAGLDGAA